jgi:hypothetical protein
VQVTFFSLTSFISSANKRKESLTLQSQTEEMQLAGAELCKEMTYNFASGFQCSQKKSDTYTGGGSNEIKPERCDKEGI